MLVSRKTNTSQAAEGSRILATVDLQARVSQLEELVDSQARQLADLLEDVQNLDRAYKRNSERVSSQVANIQAAVARPHPPAPSVNCPEAVIPAVQQLARRVIALEKAHPPAQAGNIQFPAAHPPAEMEALAQRVEAWAQWGRGVAAKLEEIDHDLERCLAQQQRWYLSQRGGKARDFAATHIPN